MTDCANTMKKSSKVERDSSESMWHFCDTVKLPAGWQACRWHSFSGKWIIPGTHRIELQKLDGSILVKRLRFLTIKAAQAAIAQLN